MEPRRRRRWSIRLLLILVPFLGLTLWYASFAVAYVANLRVYFIPSGSMSPTIAPGDRITIDRGAGSPGRGEIWVFSMPDGATLVKRVIGLPGETIEVSGGRVLIDDRPIDEPYLDRPDDLRDAADHARPRRVFRARRQPERQQRQPHLGPDRQGPVPRPGRAAIPARRRDRRAQ